MSFAEEVREELCDLSVKKPCCKRALTAGLLIGARSRSDKQIKVRYRCEAVATLASAMIRAQFGRTADSEMTGACGHRYYDLTFESGSAKKQVELFDLETREGVETLKLGCDACRASFLRGAFLASGSVNDPHKSFHLEFLVPNVNRAAHLSFCLAEAGYPPRTVKRQESVGVYYKDGASIEELITLMGAQHVVFEIINSRIERDIRNNENRATNCVAKNIEKTISAATRQIEAIGALMECGRLDSFPEALRVTAMVRYRNPDATLDELVALHDPPISKSGLNHRLSKLMDEAEKIGKKKK